MAKSYLKETVQENRPQATAAELIQCIQENDLGVKEGKRAMWRLLGRLPPFYKSEVQRLRDKYLAERYHLADANRLAMLDLAATLPTAHELPDGLLDSMRPGGIPDPRGGLGAYAARDDAEVARNPSAVELPTADPDLPLVEKTYAPLVPPVKTAAPPPKTPARKPAPLETQFEQLSARVRECSVGKPTGIGQSVVWVSAHLRTPFDRIDAEGVPGAEALALLLWASQNETEYRRLYDSKRIPSRGIAEDQEKGFMDAGDPIEDIIARIRKAGWPKESGKPESGESHVSMRHLPSEEPGGDDAGPQGGVHGLPECPVAGRESGDLGREGGPGGHPDGEPGAGVPGPAPGGEAGNTPAPPVGAGNGESGSSGTGETGTRTAP